ncbi:hypothetical protein COCNU_01G001940 [Cocos nucifera]|uniref:Uncharacterized protein n=1 Tax=Cocos nucifera TaxID=13894 RepID=A0A8K0MUB6_COCNU|nr:hypothetical protein COCNU_01G001940 [Cocos nucifera]
MAAMEELGGPKMGECCSSLAKGGKKPDPKHPKKSSFKPTNAKPQAMGSKKPPKDLKAKSVKSLIATCVENVVELLGSNFSKEVAIGGTDGALQPLGSSW